MVLSVSGVGTVDFHGRRVGWGEIIEKINSI